MKLQASLKKEYELLKKQIEKLWEKNQLGDPRITDFSKVKVEIELQAFHLPINVGKENVGFMYFEPVVITTTGDFVDQTMSLALQAPYFQTTETIAVRMILKVNSDDYVFDGRYSFTKSSVSKTKAFKQTTKF